MPCSGSSARYSLSLSLVLLTAAPPCLAVDSFLSNNPQAPEAVPYGRTVDQLLAPTPSTGSGQNDAASGQNTATPESTPIPEP